MSTYTAVGSSGPVGLMVFLVALLCSVPSLSAEPLIIDSFDYPDDSTAQAAWIERAGSPPVEMADSGDWGSERVMKLPCDFGVQPTRCYWDGSVPLDLSAQSMFELELFVSASDAVSLFTLYFHSGDGWYGRSVPITENGWQTLRFFKPDFVEEGLPGGWHVVDAIRLSVWKGSDQDTYLAVRELRALTPDVFIVRDDLAGSAATVSRTVELLSDLLEVYDVSFAVIGGSAVEGGYLNGDGMAILPYNETVPDPQMTRIESYVASGGTLMVFYLLTERLEDLLGIDRTGWVQGDFAAFTFADNTIQYLPDRVHQASWNITLASPRPVLNAQVIAEWEDGAGVPTGSAAWLASDNGLFMSHILLDDDELNKQVMLLALIGHHVPQIWPGASAASIERIGRIAEYGGFDEAVAEIEAKGAGTPRWPEVQSFLAAAARARDQALVQHAAQQYGDAVWSAIEAREQLLEAFYRCQSAALPEFRAVWEHAGTGPFPGDWAAAIDTLVANGFSAVLPNMLSAGLAHYDSALLPHSEAFGLHGDQIAACVEAAHARGVEVHVWKVNWNLDGAPQSFIDAMHATDRTQLSAYGESIDWLCPSHPDNFALERDTMLEVVQRYDVDGIHFDYIRYPGRDYCYCDGCRIRFEADTGQQVADWPADVLAGGPLESAYLVWRREQITQLVEAVYAGAKALKPEIRLSAAVFKSYAYAFDGVGQDWVEWIDRDIIDFLCPMDYTNNFDHFRGLVAEQMGYAAGRIPIYPGIGASSSAGLLGADGVVAQILATREATTGGFVLFDYDRDLATTYLPALGKGATIPGSVGETPDGDLVSGTPLTFARPGSGLLELRWGHACDHDAQITSYAVYRGTLASLATGVYDHVPEVCDTDGGISVLLAMGPGNEYYLIVPNDTNREGGYGFDSEGMPRPASDTPCLPQLRADCP